MRTEDGEIHEVATPDPVYSMWVGPNEEYETRTLRYGYTSLVAPLTDFDYDLETRNVALVKQQPVLGGYDMSAYVTERVWATATDGTADPDLGRAPPRHAGRRLRAGLVLRLRLVRDLDRPGVPLVAPFAARPRLRLRDRARPRRRRDGPPRGTSRAGSSTR